MFCPQGEKLGNWGCGEAKASAEFKFFVGSVPVGPAWVVMKELRRQKVAFKSVFWASNVLLVVTRTFYSSGPPWRT